MTSVDRIRKFGTEVGVDVTIERSRRSDAWLIAARVLPLGGGATVEVEAPENDDIEEAAFALIGLLGEAGVSVPER